MKIIRKNEEAIIDIKTIMRSLLRLNLLEETMAAHSFRTNAYKSAAGEVTSMRGDIPAPILAHHDRKRARGRSSVAAVRHWVCTSCFISVPQGRRSHLTQCDDLSVCDNCGSYLFLETPDPTQAAPAPVPVPKIKSVSPRARVAAKKSVQRLAVARD